MHTYMHVNRHKNTNTYTYMHTNVYKQVYSCTCIFAHTHAYTPPHMCTGAHIIFIQSLPVTSDFFMPSD